MIEKSKEKHERAGKVWVSRMYKKGPEEQHEEKLEIRKFETEPAWVRANYGLTINLGNYESARCDCGVTLPCYVEEIPAAFEQAWDMAKKEIQIQVADIKTGK